MAKQPIARFTFLLDPDLKQSLERACVDQDITPSQLLRQLIKARIAAQEKTDKAVRKAPPSRG